MSGDLKKRKLETIAAAEAKLEEDKFVDAANIYEKVAQISKEMGEVSEYEKYRELASDCLNLRLELIVIEDEERKAGAEEMMMPPPKPKIEEKEVQIEISAPEFKKGIDQLMEQTKMSFVKIVDAMQKFNLSDTKIRKLAEKAEYEVTKRRIYQKGTLKKSEEEDADEFSDLDDLDAALATEDKK